MVRTATELGKGARIGIALGAVSCNFRREIKPYEAFELWTRILSWDRKWLYTVSHFVKKGSVKPKGWTLQPWRKIGPAQGDVLSEEGTTAEDVQRLEMLDTAENDRNRTNGAISPSAIPAHPAIFASAIAKYVFKHKRLTISPERILRNSNLLPPEPEALVPPPPLKSKKFSSFHIHEASSTLTPDTTLLSIPGASETVRALSSPAPSAADANTHLKSSTESPDSWTWTRIEAERQRGLRIAEHFASLEELNGEFKYDGNLVLGEYTDLI